MQTLTQPVKSYTFISSGWTSLLSSISPRTAYTYLPVRSWNDMMFAEFNVMGLSPTGRETEHAVDSVLKKQAVCDMSRDRGMI